MQDTDLKTEETVTNEETQGSDKRVYEVGYLLLPSLSEEEVPVMYGNIKEAVSILGGAVISDEMPKMLSLSYMISKVTQNVRSKYTSAYFGWVKFDLSSEMIAELKKKLTADPSVLRFLIIKTVRGNTVVGRRFGAKSDGKKRTYTKKKEEPGEPIDKAEIDKEIEAMVSV